MLFDTSYAEFSPCRVYRYTLTRVIRGNSKRVITWIMLNPSTADETQDDPTIRRVLDFSRRWGFGVVHVVNLFALRATDPKVMLSHVEPIGADNDAHILQLSLAAEMVVCAWGAHGSHRGRGDAVKKDLLSAGVSLHCLKLTASAQPGHPLYLSSLLTPKAFP